MASTAFSTVPYAVMSTVSVSGATLLLARSRSIPDIPGIMRSVSRTDTGSRRRISSASPPDPAVRTRNDSRSRIFWSESTIGGSSSTTSTVGASDATGINSIPLSSSTRMPARVNCCNYLNTQESILRQIGHDVQSGANLTSCRHGATPAASLSRGRILGRGRLLRARRQGDSKSGALSHAALHLDASAVAIDDPVHDRQTQARSRAHVLGREEGIEDSRDDLGGDSGPVVGDRDLDVLAAGGGGEANR